MLTRRVVVCLDVKGGRVVKGTQFVQLRDVGDPVELATRYEREGADEVVFLDISASAEERGTLLDVARRTAECLFVPLTIGGGVPRNWSQQFGPFIELRHRRLGENVPLKRYHYGLRICPEPVYWGGLSGSPYSEAISWGKFVPPAEGGRFAEVLSDATLVWPLLMVGLLERSRAKSASA